MAVPHLPVVVMANVQLLTRFSVLTGASCFPMVLALNSDVHQVPSGMPHPKHARNVIRAVPSARVPTMTSAWPVGHRPSSNSTQGVQMKGYARINKVSLVPSALWFQIPCLWFKTQSPHRIETGRWIILTLTSEMHSHGQLSWLLQLQALLFKSYSHEVTTSSSLRLRPLATTFPLDQLSPTQTSFSQLSKSLLILQTSPLFLLS